MILLKNSLLIFIWFIVSYFIFLFQPLRDFESYIISLKPDTYNTNIKQIQKPQNSELIQLHMTFEGDTSLSAYIKIPLDSAEYPAIIILGGMMTGKDAVNYAYGVNNVILAAPDYRYKPRYDYNFFTIAYDLLEGFNATYLQVVDNLLLIDFLKNWDKTKNKKLSILGYSFGVPFAAATARFNSLDYMALVYGGADLKYLINHNLKLFNPIIDSYLANLFWLHVINFEPVTNLKQINPIPTLIINGENDEKIPNVCAQKIQDTIKYKKTVIWIDSKHVHPANKKLSIQIINNLNTWYQNNNFFNGQNYNN